MNRKNIWPAMAAASCIAAILCTANARANPTVATAGDTFIIFFVLACINFSVDFLVFSIGDLLLTKAKPTFRKRLGTVLAIFIMGLLIDAIVLWTLAGALHMDTATAAFKVFGFVFAFALLFLVDVALIWAVAAVPFDNRLKALGVFMAVLTNPFLYIAIFSAM